jgi:PAS domain S-box-containing protein
MSLSRNYWGSILKQVQIGVLAILTILCLIVADWLFRDTQKKLFSELKNTAYILDQYYEQSFYHRELSLASVGYRLLDIKGPKQDSLRLVSARSYLNDYFELKAFGLADTTGQLTTFTGHKIGVPNPSLVDSEHSKRSFLLAKRSDRMVIGEVYYFNAIADWVIPIRVPLLNTDGELIALNTSAVDYNSMVNTLDGFELDPDFRIHMVNAHFNTTQLYYPLLEKSYAKWLGKDASIYTDTLYSDSKNRNFNAFNLIEGVEVLGVKTNSGLLNHYLIVSVDKDVLQSRFLSRVKFILMIYILLLLVIYFGIKYLKRKDFRHSRALLKEREYSENIIIGSPSLIIGISNRGICEFANPAALEAIGYSEKEIIGQNWWKKLYPENYYEQAIKLFEDVELGEILDYEMTLVRKDGMERVISWNSLSFFNEEGVLKEIVGFGHDVTELKAAQKELQMYTEDLEGQVKLRTGELTDSNRALLASNYQLNQQHQVLKDTLENLEKTQKQLFQSDKMASLGVLVAGVGHEINNPLNFINGGVQGLKNLDSNGGAEAKPFFDIIEEGVKRASNIVKSLSHFSRRTGKMDEKCDLHLIINNCLTILHNKLKHSIEVEKKFTNNNVIIKGSEGKLHQAILNVLSNAQQAIEGTGKITIKTDRVGKQIKISIKDTGVGIPKENLSKVVDPFFTTKNTGEGTGLGLSITYSIIEEHQGRIELSSKIGQGTEFILIFPN